MRSDARFCSKECRGIHWHGSHPAHFDTGLSRTANGARAELLAAAKLMIEGYEVFRALEPGSSCDLVALKNGQASRVEVRTAMLGIDGSHRFTTRGEYDLIVSVYGDEVRIGRQ
jgi:hypothetical protein